MITLGIESTAHTFGIGIIKDKNVLANVKDSFTTESGGMIPSELTRHHEEINEKVIAAIMKMKTCPTPIAFFVLIPNTF